MRTLNKTLRNKLESAIKEARDLSEEAAKAVLRQLGVDKPEPPAYLDIQDLEKRKRLRDHAIQLGDNLDDAGESNGRTDRLAEEIAYEHWHGMLFAKFLERNDLLMFPDPINPVPITLAECEELAPEKGASSGWELASKYAAETLPQIFRIESPAFSVKFSSEFQNKLEKLIEDLPDEVYSATDSLGWIYQFWQVKKKKDVIASEVKIGERELPAVTQLFTEQYMVRFLLCNSLGAWWAGNKLSPLDLESAASEEELRNKLALPGLTFDYLRFARDEGGTWIPAAGIFELWPKNFSNLKIIDPCCGSGHFLVAAFMMLVPLRVEAEGLSAREAVNAVLCENLYGLEIDKRCVEIAVFALAMAAWKYPETGGYRLLPEFNIACSGIPVKANLNEWLELAENDDKAISTLALIHNEFNNAPILGSLINPTESLRKGSLLSADWKTTESMLEKALSKETNKSEIIIAAKGITKASELLANQYSLVVTNVPYLKSSKQTDILRAFCDKNYPESKHDLATAFIERCLKLCDSGGVSCLVLPDNWTQLQSYAKLRKTFLTSKILHLITKLGSNAFQTPMWAFNIMLLIISMKRYNDERNSTLSQTKENKINFVDVSDCPSMEKKDNALKLSKIKQISQKKQLGNLDARILADTIASDNPLGMVSQSHSGLTTGDKFRMIFYFWELQNPDSRWIPFQGTVSAIRHFGGFSYLLRWEGGHGTLDELVGARIVGIEAWKKSGVSVSQMGSLPVSLYNGEAFDTNTAVIIPRDRSLLPAIWCFCSSSEYNKTVRLIDKNMKVTSATLVKVPYDSDHWIKVAKENYPHGLPKPYTDDPREYYFHGHPCGSVIWDDETKRTAFGPLREDASVLQVAAARLLGYRWPAETRNDMTLAPEQQKMVSQCSELLQFRDEDGIVCVSAVRGEAAAEGRLLEILSASYGKHWSNNVLSDLLRASDHGGKSLESWLRDKFFLQHCKFFQNRPFIWQIWDGLKNGFSALVNYNKFDHKLLESLIYTYLGDWIIRQKDDISHNLDGAKERLDKAMALQKRLEAILHGEDPYDIFVRWKPMEEQPIGWNPDLNDGVRLNIRPFVTGPDIGRKGSGVLRDNPGIKWDKDRGKENEKSPWFRLDKGDRINDRHLKLDVKKAARG
ncbi:MAG: N-6 DNA methylase [Deltaproteobacteria bacterium]|jgi:hypothetical protein|nr:N-6 DNA methylase [Deltaproteobacteria bacterium]